MKRRQFMALLGSVALRSVEAHARQSTMPVVGLLVIVSRTSGIASQATRAFQEGLAEKGYAEGKNVSFDYRSAEGRSERMATLATELVIDQVDVIIAGGTPAALAAKAATTTIPIVFTVGADPVAAGLVASLNRPGGNLTGISMLASDVAAKRLQMLHEIVAASAVALIVNPNNPVFVQHELEATRKAAHSMGLQLHVVEANDEIGFAPAFASLVEQHVGALIVSGDALFLNRRDQIIALAEHYSMPAIYAYAECATIGGLMSYGYSVPDEWHTLGVYAGRILNGEKPSHLPVVQPSTFELVINLRTAKALGLTIPLPILARADQVIE